MRLFFLVLASLIFLSSGHAETQYAGVSGTWDTIRVSDGRWLSSERAAYDRPVVYRAYSQFEVKNTPVRFLFRSKVDTSQFGCNAYTRYLGRLAQYDALVEGPRAPRYDWRRFWTWLATIGTIVLALCSAILYGSWRSTK